MVSYSLLCFGCLFVPIETLHCAAENVSEDIPGSLTAACQTEKSYILSHAYQTA